MVARGFSKGYVMYLDFPIILNISQSYFKQSFDQAVNIIYFSSDFMIVLITLQHNLPPSSSMPSI